MSINTVDALDNRVFRFKVGSDEAANTDPVMILKLESMPILNISDYDLEHKQLDNKSITNTEPTNQPYDPDFESDTYSSRFTFVCKAPAVYSNIGYAVYRDNKYGDLILMPDLDQYPVESMLNMTITFNSYKIGVKDLNSVINYSLSAGIPDNTTVPDPTAPDTVTKYDLNFHGIRTRTNPDIVKQIAAGNMFEAANIVSVIQLDRASVFGDVDLPTSVIVPESIQKHRIMKPIKSKPTYIYIPIPL